LTTPITVRAKLPGRRRPAVEALVFKPDVAPRTCGDLLTAIVRQQVDAFSGRREQDGLLRVLTGAEIEERQSAGRIVVGDQERDERVADPDQAVAAAITAFGDGLFYFFVNDVQVERLDQVVDAAGVRDVLFVRLTPLAGG